MKAIFKAIMRQVRLPNCTVGYLLPQIFSTVVKGSRYFFIFYAYCRYGIQL